MKNVPNSSILVSWELEEKVQWSLIKLYNKQLNLWFHFGFCYPCYHKHCSWQGAIEICKAEMTKLESVWISQELVCQSLVLPSQIQKGGQANSDLIQNFP